MQKIETIIKNRIAEYFNLPAIDEKIFYNKVYTQTAVPNMRRKNKKVAALVFAAQQAYKNSNKENFGRVYMQLATIFNPTISWALSSWDYLLTTEGCRFLPRPEAQKQIHRSDYRAFLHNDFQRLIYDIFKETVLSFKKSSSYKNFNHCLRGTFWQNILSSYKKLENPINPNERKLTPYSYLRCSPYQFLNPYHQQLVYKYIRLLPKQEHDIIRLYFLHFLTEPAVAAQIKISPTKFQEFKQSALDRLLKQNILVWALLLQIERY